jgi:hypothetical protein
MGLDAVLGPADGFRDWTQEQWDRYAEQFPEPEGDKLGGYGAIACSVQTIRANLSEGNYPEFLRIADSAGGWYWCELDSLLVEIRAIRRGLTNVPLERAVVLSDDGEPRKATTADVDELRRDFATAFPGRELKNLADFNHYLLDTLERLAETAKTRKMGLVLC